LEKFLESSGIKLSAVVSNLNGASSRAILDALIAGERDPAVLAELAKGKLRRKVPELVDALHGRFTDHHAFMVAEFLHQIDESTALVDRLTARIEEAMEPFRAARDLLSTIPGVSTTVAEVIIAETGADMTVFESADRLASWAGVCPGQNESAGRVKSAHTRPGNKHLKAALGVAALAVTHTNGTYLTVKYRRLAARRGPLKAVVAIERTILVAAWHMLQTGETYTDPGPDYYTRLDPQKARNKAIRQLQNLGYQVTITPTAA
jgi:transposase